MTLSLVAPKTFQEGAPDVVEVVLHSRGIVDGHAGGVENQDREHSQGEQTNPGNRPHVLIKYVRDGFSPLELREYDHRTNDPDEKDRCRAEGYGVSIHVES